MFEIQSLQWKPVLTGVQLMTDRLNKQILTQN
jgi:hypothetical protein